MAPWPEILEVVPLYRPVPEGGGVCSDAFLPAAAAVVPPDPVAAACPETAFLASVSAAVGLMTREVVVRPQRSDWEEWPTAVAVLEDRTRLVWACNSSMAGDRGDRLAAVAAAAAGVADLLGLGSRGSDCNLAVVTVEDLLVVLGGGVPAGAGSETPTGTSGVRAGPCLVVVDAGHGLRIRADRACLHGYWDLAEAAAAAAAAVGSGLAGSIRMGLAVLIVDAEAA